MIVRTHDDSDLDRLLRAGATAVVPEIIEGSMMLASHALLLLGVPVARVAERVAEARGSRYRMLSGSFHGADDKHGEADDARSVRMRSVTVPAHSHVVGRTLAEIGVEGLGAVVTAIRRHGIRGRGPGAGRAPDGGRRPGPERIERSARAGGEAHLGTPGTEGSVTESSVARSVVSRRATTRRYNRVPP